MSQLGGRSACYDAAAAMEALCCAPELDIANGACNGLMAAGGPAHLVRVGAGGGERRGRGAAGKHRSTQYSWLLGEDDKVYSWRICRAPGSCLKQM